MIQKIGNSKNKIFSFLMGISLLATSCGEPKERQMAYMTPSNRADFEAYGVLPDYIENNSSDTDALWGVFLVAFAVGFGFVVTKADDAIKKRRNQRLQQMQKNNQR